MHELDFVVAEAVGIDEFHIVESPASGHEHIFRGGAEFKPSTDLNDAYWAAGQLGKLVEIQVLPRKHCRVAIYPDDLEFQVVVADDKSPTIAVCKAIIRYAITKYAKSAVNLE